MYSVLNGEVHTMARTPIDKTFSTSSSVNKMNVIQQFIDGQLIQSSGTATIPVLNPATEEIIAYAPQGTAADVDRAVSAARDALPAWQQRTAAERGCFLIAIADELDQRASEIARVTSLNNGKPIAEAFMDLEDAIATYRYYGENAGDLLDARQDHPVPVRMPAYASRTRLDSVGVAALIVPWNFPLMTTAWKLAPALLAGCTTVLKPSEFTPLPEFMLADIAQTINLPAGVLNIVNGSGSKVGESLVSHPGISKVSFTGSNRTGTQVMRAAASNARNISLELGGKSPIIVFEDSDPELAAEWIAAGIFFNAGQMCSATSRLLIHESIADDILHRVKDTAQAIKLGDPLAADTGMGPLITRAQYNKSLAYLRIAHDEGLKKLTEDRTTLPASGFFFPPTIFTEVPTHSRLWREEIFAPVLCSRTFASETEAIELANDSNYGLAATVASADMTRAQRVTNRLEAGHVWLNGPQVALPETSWGGYKESGIGRELGPWGLNAFLEVKHVTYPA